MHIRAGSHQNAKWKLSLAGGTKLAKEIKINMQKNFQVCRIRKCCFANCLDLEKGKNILEWKRKETTEIKKSR